MKLNSSTIHFAAALGLGLLVLPSLLHAQTATVVGIPANFDAINDTGGDTHGFEIEADGITSADVTRIFGDNFFVNGGPCFIRYCQGQAIDFPGGVYIRWTSPWDPAVQQFTLTTPIPNGTLASGESCWTVALGARYPAAGCEHFGISTIRNPTRVVYRWLVADPNNPGQLAYFTGTPVAPPPGVVPPPPAPVPVYIPHPYVVVNPPAQPGNPPVVDFQVQLPAPPPPPVRVVPQFGPAQWVKVFKSEVDHEVDLNDLLAGNPVVPDAALVETPWKLLQTNPKSANSGILHNGGALGNGKHAVVRRYEYYKYTGKLDPVTNEALCADVVCNAPGAGELGDMIGAQMAAANLEIPSITVTRVGNGTVSGASGKINCGGACTAQVTAGTPITLTAVVPGNSVFGGWSGACTGMDLTCSLTVNSALNTTATFVPVYTLSIGRGGNGTVTGTPQGAFNTSIACGSNCSAKFPQGTSVTLMATPSAGLNFVNWTGACSGTTPTCTVSIAKDTQVQANFK
jgi:hypothetical protein